MSTTRMPDYLSPQYAVANRKELKIRSYSIIAGGVTMIASSFLMFNEKEPIMCCCFVGGGIVVIGFMFRMTTQYFIQESYSASLLQNPPPSTFITISKLNKQVESKNQEPLIDAKFGKGKKAQINRQQKSLRKPKSFWVKSRKKIETLMTYPGRLFNTILIYSNQLFKIGSTTSQLITPLPPEESKEMRKGKKKKLSPLAPTASPNSTLQQDNKSKKKKQPTSMQVTTATSSAVPPGGLQAPPLSDGTPVAPFTQNNLSTTVTASSSISKNVSLSSKPHQPQHPPSPSRKEKKQKTSLLVPTTTLNDTLQKNNKSEKKQQNRSKDQTASNKPLLTAPSSSFAVIMQTTSTQVTTETASFTVPLNELKTLLLPDSTSVTSLVTASSSILQDVSSSSEPNQQQYSPPPAEEEKKNLLSEPLPLVPAAKTSLPPQAIDSSSVISQETPVPLPTASSSPTSFVVIDPEKTGWTQVLALRQENKLLTTKNNDLEQQVISTQEIADYYQSATNYYSNIANHLSSYLPYFFSPPTSPVELAHSVSPSPSPIHPVNNRNQA